MIDPDPVNNEALCMSKRPRRILLVNPPFLEERIHEEDIRPMPIGLYNVAAVLKTEGYEVTLHNLNDGRQSPERVVALIEQFRPDVIGFSIMNANRWGGIDIARRAKALDAKIVTVFGGVGASYLWEHLLTHFAAIDYVVIGEGERAFLELVRCIEENAGADVAQLGGIAFRKKGRPERTACYPLIEDLDRLPDPTQYYTYPHLSLTRGCPANCRFCGSPGFWGRQVRFHSPGYFVGQIERLASRGISFFYVSDDTFTLRKKTVLAVCREIIARQLNICWAAISRVDTVDEEILRWMRKAGCIQISYGIESANRDVRRFLDKRIKLDDVRAAFAATRRYGILPRAYFIYGCPGDSHATMQETLDLIREIKPLGAIFYLLAIFPGTQLYEAYLERTGKTDDIWLAPMEDILYFETDPTMDRDKIQEYGRILRTGFYRMLPGFAGDIDLVDDPGFYVLHADFLSRLAMTFHQGDLAHIEAIPDKQETAEKLYRRALHYHPDARAFLGLGMLCQQRGDFGMASELLDRGLSHYPKDAALQMCMAVNHMNQGFYREALQRLQQMEQTSQTRKWIARCREAMKA
jgi:anaerobic magnesium-protoporphyrin IX monomethyl ester cyclase